MNLSQKQKDIVQVLGIQAAWNAMRITMATLRMESQAVNAYLAKHDSLEAFLETLKQCRPTRNVYTMHPTVIVAPKDNELIYDLSLALIEGDELGIKACIEALSTHTAASPLRSPNTKVDAAIALCRGVDDFAEAIEHAFVHFNKMCLAIKPADYARSGKRDLFKAFAQKLVGATIPHSWVPFDMDGDRFEPATAMAAAGIFRITFLEKLFRAIPDTFPQKNRVGISLRHAIEAFLAEGPPLIEEEKEYPETLRALLVTLPSGTLMSDSELLKEIVKLKTHRSQHIYLLASIAETVGFYGTKFHIRQEGEVIRAALTALEKKPPEQSIDEYINGLDKGPKTHEFLQMMIALKGLQAQNPNALHRLIISQANEGDFSAGKALLSTLGMTLKLCPLIEETRKMGNIKTYVEEMLQHPEQIVAQGNRIYVQLAGSDASRVGGVPAARIQQVTAVFEIAELVRTHNHRKGTNFELVLFNGAGGSPLRCGPIGDPFHHHSGVTHSMVNPQGVRTERTQQGIAALGDKGVHHPAYYMALLHAIDHHWQRGPHTQPSLRAAFIEDLRDIAETSETTYREIWTALPPDVCAEFKGLQTLYGQLNGGARKIKRADGPEVKEPDKEPWDKVRAITQNAVQYIFGVLLSMVTAPQVLRDLALILEKSDLTSDERQIVSDLISDLRTRIKLISPFIDLGNAARVSEEVRRSHQEMLDIEGAMNEARLHNPQPDVIHSARKIIETSTDPEQRKRAAWLLLNASAVIRVA